MKKALMVSVGMFWLPLSALSLHGQSNQSVNVELANIREDVRLLSQRVGEFQLRIEMLEKENGDLRARTANQNYATITQLNEAIAELNRAAKASDASTKAEILQQVSGQLEKLGKQTNAALDSIAKSTAAPRSPVTAPTFSEDYPKEGVSHVVQKGESLGSIAKLYGARQQDIINANKISDASKIQVGQKLFIAGGK